MVNISTGPKATKPARVLGGKTTQSGFPTTKIAPLGSQVTSKTSGYASRSPTESAVISAQLAQQKINQQANLQQKMKVAQINPAVRASLVIPNAGTGGSSVYTGNIPVFSFGKNVPFDEKIQNYSALKANQIEIPEQVFSRTQGRGYAGKSDEEILGRIKEAQTKGILPADYKPMVQQGIQVQSKPIMYGPEKPNTIFPFPTQASELDNFYKSKPQAPTPSADLWYGPPSPKTPSSKSVNQSPYGDTIGGGAFRGLPIALAPVGRFFEGFGAEAQNIASDIQWLPYMAEAYATGKEEPPRLIPTIDTSPRAVEEAIPEALFALGDAEKVEKGAFKGLPYLDKSGKILEAGYQEGQKRFEEDVAFQTGATFANIGAWFIPIGGPIIKGLQWTGKIAPKAVKAGSTLTKSKKVADVVKEPEYRFKLSDLRNRGLGDATDTKKIYSEIGKDTGKGFDPREYGPTRYDMQRLSAKEQADLATYNIQAGNLPKLYDPANIAQYKYWGQTVKAIPELGKTKSVWTDTNLGWSAWAGDIAGRIRQGVKFGEKTQKSKFKISDTSVESTSARGQSLLEPQLVKLGDDITPFSKGKSFAKYADDYGQKSSKSKGIKQIYELEPPKPKQKPTLIPKIGSKSGLKKGRPFPLLPFELGGIAGIGAGLSIIPIIDTGQKEKQTPDEITLTGYDLGQYQPQDQPQAQDQPQQMFQPNPERYPPFEPAVETPRLGEVPLYDFQFPPRSTGRLVFPPFQIYGSGSEGSSGDSGYDQRFWRVFASAKTPFGKTELPLGEFVDSPRPVQEIIEVISGKEIRRLNRFGGLQNPLRAPKNIVEENLPYDILGLDNEFIKKKGKRKGRKNDMDILEDMFS